MEINKMLTISTAHISEETAKLLDKDEIGIPVFNKGNYGWFIFVPQYNDYVSYIPKDLNHLLTFAKDCDCDWLCLDADGEILDYLETFVW